MRTSECVGFFYAVMQAVSATKLIIYKGLSLLLFIDSVVATRHETTGTHFLFLFHISTSVEINNYGDMSRIGI